MILLESQPSLKTNQLSLVRLGSRTVPVPRQRPHLDGNGPSVRCAPTHLDCNCISGRALCPQQMGLGTAKGTLFHHRVISTALWLLLSPAPPLPADVPFFPISLLETCLFFPYSLFSSFLFGCRHRSPSQSINPLSVRHGKGQVNPLCSSEKKSRSIKIIHFQCLR